MPHSDPGADPTMTLSISPRYVATIFTALVLSLVTMHLVTGILNYQFGHDYQWGFRFQFNVDNEGNIPAWYSSSALLVASFLLALIGATKYKRRDAFAAHWLVLAGMFLYLSMDEASQLHEMSARLFDRFHPSGLFFYPWVIVGALAVLMVGLAYLKFLLHLPPEIRRIVLVAGSIFVGGALGVEAISGRHHELHGLDNLTYHVIVGIEEGCEMAGIVMFIYGLVRYLALTADKVVLSFRDDAGGPVLIGRSAGLRSGGGKSGRAA